MQPRPMSHIVPLRRTYPYHRRHTTITTNAGMWPLTIERVHLTIHRLQLTRRMNFGLRRSLHWRNVVLLSCLYRYWTVSGQPWIRLSSFADSASTFSVRSSYLPTLSRNLRQPHLLSTRKCLLPIVTPCTKRHTWCTLFKVHSTRGLCLSCFVGLDNSLLAGCCSLECSLCCHQLRPCMHASLQAQAYQVHKGNWRGKWKAVEDNDLSSNVSISDLKNHIRFF